MASTKPSLRLLAQRGLAAAEKGLDRFRYDILGPRDDAEVQIEAYRGYRSAERLVLRGRLIEKWTGQLPVGEATLSKMRNMLRLYESDELPGVEVTITVEGERHSVVTDDEGYFSLLLDTASELPVVTGWQTAKVEVEDFGGASVEAPILVPGTETKLGVISDLDDTVIETGATNFVKNWRRVLVETPEERLAVPGAPELYRMLKGEDGSAVNPVFYVSSSPWNLYGYLERFLQVQGVPEGPMFLKDYGIDDVKFIASAHTDHKVDAVKHILGFYPDLKFLLIGDDGQKDVKVYREAAEMFPERIAGVFIRDVHANGVETHHTGPLREIEEMGIKVFVGPTFEGAADLAREVGFGARA